MGKVRVIEVHENVFAANENTADRIRKMLTKNGTFFVNIMSAPGSGKTTLLSALINRLKDKVQIAEMDVDIESSLDAQRVADATGVRSLQIHNGGLCHIDADMTMRAIQEFGIEDIDLLILENIGNLVCPAEFDTGAHKNIMLLSVPEGDDKPLKYPLMFTVSDIVLITKIDTMGFFNFSMENVEKYIHALNPNALILPVSAKTGEGLEQLETLLLDEVTKIKQQA